MTLSFDTGPVPAMTGLHTKVVAGDFDGDRRCDALLYGPGSLPDAVYRGTTSAKFAKTAVSVTGVYDHIVAGDFDGNRRSDVVYYAKGTGVDVLRRGRADGSFAAAPTVAFNGNYDRVLAGDWNGDGRDDLFFYGRGAKGDVVRLGTAKGFAAGPAVSVSGGYDDIVAGDFDGDGRDDLVFYRSGPGGDVLRLGGSNGGFRAGPAISISSEYDWLVADDFNRDRRDDLLRFNGNGADSVAYARADGTFGTAYSVHQDGFVAPVGCDFDGDGYGDVLWYGPGAVVDALWLGRTPTGTSTPTTSPPGTTTTRPPTTTTPGAADATAARLCAGSVPVSQGTIAASQLVEISGVVASRDHANVLWVHNDSGDSARLFATTTSGASLGTYPLSGASANDWEDIALGPGPTAGVDYLYVGDIGDNGGSRSEIQVYRVAEPNPSGAGFTLNGVATLRLRYPDGPRDAETLLVDPGNGDLYVVSKTIAGTSRVYRAAAPVDAGPTTMTLVRQLALGNNREVTAGDIAPNGQAIVLRTYTRVHVFARPSGQALSAAFESTPCEAPAASEPQGEAIAVDPDSRGFTTISEGTNEPIYHSDAGA